MESVLLCVPKTDSSRGGDEYAEVNADLIKWLPKVNADRFRPTAPRPQEL